MMTVSDRVTPGGRQLWTESQKQERSSQVQRPFPGVYFLDLYLEIWISRLLSPEKWTNKRTEDFTARLTENTKETNFLW